jgi:tetratricopeptide (TPR) repeat protein
MKQYVLFAVLICLTLPLSAQKSKVLAARQMIDAEKFTEAKESIELAVEHRKTANWARTHYTRGLLCQTAYELGVKKDDSKLSSLYPDQLIVAYDSYEKALELDTRQRLNGQIRQRYYLLANDFRTMGGRLYDKQDYDGALKAFEHALLIGESDLISAKTDTSLIFNAGLAAFEGQNWDRAIKYLTELHDASYSPSTSLLLTRAYMNSGDTLHSEKIMMFSLEQYAYPDTMVMYVVNHMVGAVQLDTAITVLDKAIEARPGHYRFLWARALVYEEMGRYEEAIASFLQATALSDDRPELFYHLGVCYYNIGIDMRESALKISENESYREARNEYMEKFREAVRWFERSYELDPGDERTLTRLHQLYAQLQMTEKQKNLRSKSSRD